MRRGHCGGAPVWGETDPVGDMGVLSDKYKYCMADGINKRDRPDSIGMGGWIQSESVAGFVRNMHL